MVRGLCPLHWRPAQTQLPGLGSWPAPGRSPGPDPWVCPWSVVVPTPLRCQEPWEAAVLLVFLGWASASLLSDRPLLCGGWQRDRPLQATFPKLWCRPASGWFWLIRDSGRIAGERQGEGRASLSGLVRVPCIAQPHLGCRFQLPHLTSALSPASSAPSLCVSCAVGVGAGSCPREVLGGGAVRLASHSLFKDLECLLEAVLEMMIFHTLEVCFIDLQLPATGTSS